MSGGTFPIPTFASARKNDRHDALFEFDSEVVYGDADRKVVVPAALADTVAALLTGDPRRGGRFAGDAAVAGAVTHVHSTKARLPSVMSLALGPTQADLASAVIPAVVQVALHANSLVSPHVHTSLTRAVEAYPVAEASVASALKTLSLQTWTRLRLIVITEAHVRVWACSASPLYPEGRSVIVMQCGGGFNLVYADHDPAITDAEWGRTYQAPTGFDPLARDLHVDQMQVPVPFRPAARPGL